MLLVLPSGSGTMLSYEGAEPAWVFKVPPEISNQPHVSGASAREDQQPPGGRGSEEFSLDISVLEPQTEETACLYPSFINNPLKKTNVLHSWGQAESVCPALAVALSPSQTLNVCQGDADDGL